MDNGESRLFSIKLFSASENSLIRLRGYYTVIFVRHSRQFVTVLLRIESSTIYPMKPWRLIVTPAGRGAWNMAVDEAILEHVQAGPAAALPTLRLYAWDPACLSLGHAQPYADVNNPGLKERGWEVVRRATGGRAILHTDELTYSVTGSAGDPVLTGGVLESYNRIAQALLLAVKDLGLPVEMKEHAGDSPTSANPVCFEVPSTYEITVNGKKLIGSAQARKKEGVLQHGSLPLSGDLTRICQALVFENETARENAAQRLLGRATTVESALGHTVTWDEAAKAFIHAFESQLGLCFERGELSESESKRAEELLREKYDHPSWTERV
jgi:lipoate-protein ligase A